MPIDVLLHQASVLMHRATALQNVELRDDDDARLTGDYQDWFGRSIAMLEADLKDRFRNEFDGGAVTPKIRAFLGAPRQLTRIVHKNAVGLIGVYAKSAF